MSVEHVVAGVVGRARAKAARAGVVIGDDGAVRYPEGAVPVLSAAQVGELLEIGGVS